MTVLFREVATGLQVTDGGDGRTLVGPLLPWVSRPACSIRAASSSRRSGAGPEPTRTRPGSHSPPCIPRDNQQLPIGITRAIDERDDAARGEWRVSKTAAGGEVLELAADGVPLGLSIGFCEVEGGSRWSLTAAA
jgi:hypothetical protein